MDIVGASTGGTGDSAGPQRGSISLSLFYAFGHALVVLMLGLAALLCAYALPRWIDPLMERAVGFTLIVLGLWVFYSLTRSLTGGGEFRPLSRWMAMFAWITTTLNWLRSGLSSDKKVKQMQIKPYGPRTAFGVGMIHGLGAETATQVLLMATVCGSNSHVNGIAMLIAFIVGMILSNTLVAVLGSLGLISSTKIRSAYITVGAVVGVFSLVVGSYFLLGRAHQLPDLQHFLRG